MAAPPLDPAATVDRVDRLWADEIVPELVAYIRVPAVSVAFDPDWATSGHIDAVVEAAAAWARTRPIEGLRVEVVRLPGRTPVLVFEVPPFGPAAGAEGTADGADGSAATAGDDTVLLYGHLDKQPPMTGWREGLGPWTPVLEGDRLFGSITAQDLADALAAQGHTVDKRKIELEHPIKTIGQHTVPVRLHPDVIAEVRVTVAAE